MSVPESEELSSKWHSIRPWNAHLTLYTREITSVSATFILSTEPNGESDSTTVFGFSGTEADEKTDDGSEFGVEEGSSLSTAIIHAPKGKKPASLLAEILSKGLQIKINGVNWQRVLIRIDENGDEAVIVVYGLMPGREYDVDLGLVQPGQQPSSVTSIRKQVMTFDESSDPDSTGTDPDERSNSSISDPPQALSTPSTSPSRTIPNTPPATPPPSISLEDRLNQLRHNLSVINSERETLLASIKSARKDSQKADAALRAEIDALKRASEKHAANEVRTKQKILALQEAVKRAQAATRDTEQLVEDVQGEVPALLEKKATKEKEHDKLKGEADRLRKTRQGKVEKERKRHEAMRAELASLTNKLEKLTAKKEKQEGTVIPDFGQKLMDIQSEIEEEERFLEQTDFEPQLQGYVPPPRVRHQSLGVQGPPGPISRPSLPPPIQRPPISEFGARPLNHTTSLSLSSVAHQPSIWGSPSTQQSQSPFSSPSHPGLGTFHTPPSTLLARKGSLGASNALPNSLASPTVSSSSSGGGWLSGGTGPISPTSQTVTASASSSSSTLSIKAPAFEPGKGVRGLGLKILTSTTGRNGTTAGAGAGVIASQSQSPTRTNAPSIGVIGAGRR